VTVRHTPTISIPRVHIHRFLLTFAMAAFALTTACARGVPSLPGGAGTPFTDFGPAYEQATARCRQVRTFAGVLGLSGRAGDQPVRGSVDAGFAEGGRIRLEGKPPALAFGKPIFILAGRGGDATLVFPRDNRVLPGAPTKDIIEALAGVSLTADELRAAVTGCGFGIVTTASARSYPNGWAALEAGETTIWLRNINGAWTPAAAVRGPLEIRYEQVTGPYPGRIRIRTAPTGGAVAADITLRVSEVDVNIELGPEAFTVAIPDGAGPLTLDELRRSRMGG
jgi:hypothetical protein